jgi:hypothetical protein
MKLLILDFMVVRNLSFKGADVTTFDVRITRVMKDSIKVIEPFRQFNGLLRHLRAIFWKLAAQTSQRQRLCPSTPRIYLRSGAGAGSSPL